MQDHTQHIVEAIHEALRSRSEGGIPIGAVLVDQDDNIVARGQNLRVQSGDPTAHAEVVCIRNAGRRRDWHTLSLYSTLSPCQMCTGTAILFKIPRVIIGENTTFTGAEHWLVDADIEVTVLNDQRCIEMMSSFINEHPDLWNEDIGIPEDET